MSADSFANHILPDWDDAMDRFFERVYRKARDRNLTPGEVTKALEGGYGYEVADAWVDWVEGEQ